MKLEDILECVHGVIHNNYIEHLTEFLHKHPAPNWVIASDYVIGETARYKNAFCYTIYPIIGNELVSTLKEIKTRIPNDLKHTSGISNEIVECLRSRRRFSFCFIVSHGQKFF